VANGVLFGISRFMGRTLYLKEMAKYNNKSRFFVTKWQEPSKSEVGKSS